MRWTPEHTAPPPLPREPQSPAPAARGRISGEEEGAAHGLRLDGRRLGRAGWLVVLVGVAGFLLWAALAPLDKGVPASGTVKVTGNRKAVQSAADGTVARILAREGDLVRDGQPLLRLDETPARAAVAALRIQLATTQATVARLKAERDGAAEMVLPPELQRSDDQRVQAALALQRQLFASRRLALRSEIDAMRETAAGLESELAGLRETQGARREQVRALQEQAVGLRALAGEGFVSRNRLLDAERLLSQTLGALAEDAGRIGQVQRQIAEQRLRIVQRREQYQAELRAQLADAGLQAESLAERLAAAEHDLSHTVVAAPATGAVVGLAVFTEGGFVRAGERLMDVVPTGEPLSVEARVPVNLIDKVHAGLPVELMFTAFNQNRTPNIPGRVKVVGADRLVEERSGAPYYPMEVEVTAEGMRRLAGLDLRAGMPVEVFVRTGERSLLSYLFKPLLDRAHTALGEE